MNELLTTIKEVQECGRRNANWYLEHGYILLDIQSGARARQYPNGAIQQGNQFYVYRGPVYILGCPEGVKAAPPPPREAPTDNKEQTVK